MLGSEQVGPRSGRHRQLAAWLLAAWCGLGPGTPAFPAPTLTDRLHTLWIGKDADPRTLDPAITVDNNAWTITYPCYQRLVRYRTVRGRATTGVEGDLAERWSVSRDNLVWEFKLRAGQRFDDGAPVDAAAVKFSFDRLRKLGQGPSQLFPADLQVTVADPETVRFTLAAPCPYFLGALAYDGASIVDPAVLDRPGAGPDARSYLATHTAGSGPFRLVSWEKRQALVLEPNPHYGGRVRPVLRRVVVKIISDPVGKRLLLETGDLDIAEDLPAEELATLERRPGLTVTRDLSMAQTYLYLNNRRPPLDQLALRQAISWAVDYADILKNIMNGQAVQMRGVIPQGMWGHDPKVMQYTTDLDRARAILTRARIGRIDLRFLYSDRAPAWGAIARSVQASLASLGIRVELQRLSNAFLREQVAKGDFDLAIGSWSPDLADPYAFMNVWFDSARHGLPGNRSFYSNPRVDQLIRTAATLAEPAARMAKYQEAQRIVVEEAAYVYLYQSTFRIALSKGVKGYIFNPMLEYIYNLEGMHKEAAH
jgi:peptide/nickel transport system substrate-binding protein